ncbi:MAG: hypothetical protein EHM68_01325 [Lysobacterales bacterium]|nr:MAG: hypothetical protein EHM68_01325 [Xanthomonadales bacterium]
MPRRSFFRKLLHTRQTIVCWPALMLLANLFCPPLLVAAEEESGPAKLFAIDTTLEVTMTGPWEALESNEDHQGAYPARIEYRDEQGQAVQLNMTVERRGIKRQEACRYPPLKLRFEKEAVKGTTFRGQKSIKMVTHCDKGNRFDQYYVLEMLIYRMYNLLTDYSFRVRPLQVNYVDSSDGKSVDNRFAFLIEDDGDLAKRNGLKKLNVTRIGVGQLEPEMSGLFSLFQYMIGNVDWAALQGPDHKDECCHNVKLIGPEPLQAGDFAIPVPYDFDSAGLVDAEYAVPPNGLPITAVTQRLYRGYCLHNGTLEAARQQLLAREGDFLALIASETRLQPGSKKKATAFLEKFFETAKNPKRFQSYIIERCRK